MAGFALVIFCVKISFNMSDEPKDEQDIQYETDPEGAENAALSRRSSDEAEPKKSGFGKSESEAVADLKEKLASALKEKQEYLDKWQRGAA